MTEKQMEGLLKFIDERIKDSVSKYGKKIEETIEKKLEEQVKGKVKEGLFDYGDKKWVSFCVTITCIGLIGAGLYRMVTLQVAPLKEKVTAVSDAVKPLEKSVILIENDIKVLKEKDRQNRIIQIRGSKGK